MPPLTCPRDGAALVTRPYEDDIRADVCPACHGIWLDKGKLRAIEEIRERDYGEELARIPDLGYNAYEVARQKAQRPINCPKCGGEMERREYARCSQVLIDVCPAGHGVWLDCGELEQLEIFFQRARLETAAIRRDFFASLVELFE